MNAKMLRYYQKKMYGGRSIVARSIDFVLLRLVIAVILFFALLFWSHSFLGSLLISLFLTVAVSLGLLIVKRNKIKKYIEQDLKRLKQKCLLETLTFMNAADFIDYTARLFDGLDDIKAFENGFAARKKGKMIYAFHNHPQTKVDVHDVLNILRSCSGPLVFISLSEYKEDVKAICKGMDQSVTLIDGVRLLKMAAEKDMLPDEQEAQQRAENEMKESILTIEKIKNTALQKTKAKRYILCGIVVLLWSVVTGFRFYYPIIAGACFVLAFISIKQHSQGKESSDAGLS